MDEDKVKQIFEDKYEKALGISYDEWLPTAPQNEAEAYARLQEINDELKSINGEYEDAVGDEKWELGEQKERLQNEYALIEEMFNLEAQDE